MLNKYKIIINNDETQAYVFEGNIVFNITTTPVKDLTMDSIYYYKNNKTCVLYEGIDILKNSKLLTLSDTLAQLNDDITKDSPQSIKILCAAEGNDKYEEIYNQNISLIQTTYRLQKGFSSDITSNLSDILTNSAFLIQMNIIL